MRKLGSLFIGTGLLAIQAYAGVAVGQSNDQTRQVSAEKHASATAADRAGKTSKARKPAQVEATHSAKATPANKLIKPENATAAPVNKKTPAPSAGQEFVKHGAPNPGTACSTARIDKNGQLDCGTHGKAATSGKPDPR